MFIGNEPSNRSIGILQQSAENQRTSNTDADIDTSLANTLHEIGRCLLEMNRATEALEYYNRALKIKEQATLNADIDTSLANTLHEIGQCLLLIGNEPSNRSIGILQQSAENL